jgi:hypothetical protein
MDYHTSLHYMNKHKHGDPTNPSGIVFRQDASFLERLPKKLDQSILAGSNSAMQFG